MYLGKIYVITIKEKEAMNLRESKGGYMGGVGGRKGKRRNGAIIISKNKKLLQKLNKQCSVYYKKVK